MAGESSHHGSGSESVLSRVSHDGPVTVVAEEEVGATGGRWYFSRKEIEDNSPSRLDGIDLKKETTLRKSYCSFLQDLGMKLKVPQVTIATSIVFCHRFFICQSHAKNDRRTIATVCMFLAGKVEETPRPLKDVIIVSYEIIHKKDPSAAQRIKQKEVYEQQKELILLGERVVLATLGFELNVHHPYKPLVDAIKKFRVAQNALAQVAWNFVNDGLRTSLCLQFKPHHIAAGAIFLAAKFLKVKLPSDGERVWWQEFDVTPRQLEEVSNQMLELYEQNRVPASQGSGVEGNARAPSKTPAMNEEHASKQTSSRSGPERSYVNHGLSSRTAQNQRNDNSSAETDSVITDHKVEGETRDNEQVQHVVNKDNSRELPNRLLSGVGRKGEEDRERNKGSSADVEASEWNDDVVSCKSSNAAGRNLIIDKDKVKAAIEKRKKSRGEAAWKKDVIEEEYLIEELENGIELAGDDGQIKQDKRRALSKIENQDDTKDDGEIIDGNHVGVKGQSTRGLKAENGEEGEMFNDALPLLISRKRENYSPAESSPEEKRWKSDTKFQS